MGCDYEKPKTFVVIRFVDVFSKWFICHEKSYQNAFRKEGGRFETRKEAVQFAENNNCVVVFHEKDQCQQNF